MPGSHNLVVRTPGRTLLLAPDWSALTGTALANVRVRSMGTRKSVDGKSSADKIMISSKRVVARPYGFSAPFAWKMARPKIPFPASPLCSG
ncbi:Uncharacterised protein [Candidatus Anstonella stagnisolia]|nr:Uncharacterised protein [Candidatus Anstonella stagnisolia]